MKVIHFVIILLASYCYKNFTKIDMGEAPSDKNFFVHVGSRVL